MITLVLLSTLCLSIIPGVISNPLSFKPTGTTSKLPTATLSASNRSPKTIFIGRSLPEFNQDLFLGIKYADEPIRFTPAELKSAYASKDSNSGTYDLSQAGLSTSSKSVYYNATEYGNDCPAYGSDTTTLVNKGLITLNEDCFNLNIIRPNADESHGLLPVMIWIFGGGWAQGATADPRYNMSYIVEQSALNGKPVMGVSINYRLAAFGFLDSEEVRAEGNTNLALRDQRTAMRWVKKNIKVFGGDPNKITIWGESAGAYSVGAHLVTNNGDNEGLFRAAIMDSGNAVGPPYNGTEWHQPIYNRLVERAGCTNSANTLQCLRELPYETLYSTANEGLEWFATVDGSFIAQYPQISYKQGKLARVPILIGTNTDEGTSFGTTGTDTDEDCINELTTSKRWVLDRSQATQLLSYYPNIPAIGCPYGWGNITWPSQGLMYKRYESIAGDLTMVGPTAHAGTTSTTIGVQHFAEIPFVFANPVQTITPLGVETERLELGQMAARMWMSFVADLDPNGHGVSDVAKWPNYSSRAANFVFRLPRNDSYIEADTYRIDGIDYINSITR
ncbi:Carboxylesterase type B [Penicillium cf. griseofulvum]|uniref:Carboxylic ester hydrolase n=1 Tax=Penicillium cf. griseofulvum TaxID=2972120 RepID=A0A9W9T2K7_9EURO|nr:Carboxylesterase type B [Penicillium cf. griseofulvum]